MIKKYNNLSFVFGVPGLILHIAGLILMTSTDDPTKELRWIQATIVGYFMFIIGLGYYAKAKSRHPAWGFLGLLSIFALFFLACLKDLSYEPKTLPYNDYEYKNNELKYGGFWKRFCASIIDSFVFFPIALLVVFLQRHSLELTIIVVIFHSVSYWFYDVYFHGRWGATLGKMATGIKVVKATDGSNISFKESLWRFSVNLFLGILSLVSHLIAYLSITSIGYSDMDWLERARVIQEHSPKWLPMNVISNITGVWVYSELLVLLCNKRKRALHDFIAGTVVIYKETQPVDSVPK